MPLEGRMSVGNGEFIEVGELGLFPEGVHYGPEEPSGESLSVVWQFGGPSGLGFMSTRQLNVGTEELEELGVFRGGRFYRGVGKGRAQDGYEAVWEHVNGRRISYPVGRYRRPIVINYMALEGVKLAGGGVEWRELGSFGGNGPEMSLVNAKAGSSVVPKAGPGVLTGVMLSGKAVIDGAKVAQHSAFGVYSLRRATLSIIEDATIAMVRLPAFSPSSWEGGKGGSESRNASE